MDEIRVTREVKVNIPKDLADYIEQDLNLSLTGFVNRATITLLKDFVKECKKKSSEVKDGKENPTGRIFKLAR